MASANMLCALSTEIAGVTRQTAPISAPAPTLKTYVKLTDAQRRAIEHEGHNLQLIACAGSGKTEVVARRVVHLLTPGRPDSLRPANIIAFTFTDKAAAELKERVVT